MKLEIVDQDANTLVREDNQQIVPSIGDEIWVKDSWYLITDRTFFYYEEGTTIHLCSKLVEGA
jgi:hypothetical protein